MAHKLGAAFLRCTMGPLNYAGGCLLGGKVPEGLKELAADNLHGGFIRGVAEVARVAGAGVADVEKILPVAEVRAAATRLDAAQKAAAASWGAHASQLGGLMTGVADLTVDGRAPDASQLLARLAKKVVRDQHLCGPLETLSVEVGTWMDLVERCGDLVGDGAELTRAYQARRLRRLIGLGVLGVALAGLGGAGLWLRAARARIDAALAATEADPCAAAALDASALGRASDAQRERVAEAAKACEEGKKRAEEIRAEKERLEAAARELERLEKEKEARCAALAEHVAAGALGPDDATLVGPQAALVDRIAKRALEKADLEDVTLPCTAAKGGEKITVAYAEAVVRSPAAWARPDGISKAAAGALVQSKDALPGAPKQVLAQHADQAALKAIAAKDEAAMAKAGALCQLTDDIGLRGGKYCATLKVLAKRP